MTKKKPKKKSIFYYLLKVVLWFFLLIVGAVLGHIIEGYYNDFTAVPSIEIEMPQHYNEQGRYELTLISGEKKLHNVSLKVKSCYMDGFKEVFAGELTSKRDKSVLFYDELTLNRSKIADCAFDPLGSFHDREVWFDLYKSKTTGELIFPYQQKVYWGCGICYWNISFESDEINKDFYEEMYSPVDIIVSIGDEKEVINYSDLEFFESIGVGFLDDKGLRMEGYR